MSPDARRLCLHGAILFFLGLLNGALVPAFTNTRLGLSAHLAGVQNGMVLLIFGLLWKHLALAPGRLRVAAWSSIGSMYAIWLALLLGAVFGTSRATPIAGAGHVGAAWQEALVTGLLYAGSLGILVGALLVILGLAGRTAHEMGEPTR
jgi:hydroxylaminobenzene mutase